MDPISTRPSNKAEQEGERRRKEEGRFWPEGFDLHLDLGLHSIVLQALAARRCVPPGLVVHSVVSADREDRGLEEEEEGDEEEEGGVGRKRRGVQVQVSGGEKRKQPERNAKRGVVVVDEDGSV